MHAPNNEVIAQPSLDPHTASLLESLPPGQLLVSSGPATTQVLQSWAAAAATGSGPLLLADGDLRAEGNALANLLDTPGVGTAILLAHNGADELNTEVAVVDGQVDPEGDPNAFTAGLLRVAHADRLAFAEALRTTSGAAHSGGAWQTALDSLLAAKIRVTAVPADPFCASRGSMELPNRSEPDRRHRSAGDVTQDFVTARGLRVLSRRLTTQTVSRGWSSTTLTVSGLAIGVLSALIFGLGSRPAALAGAVLLQLTSLALLADGEVARYLRRTTARGAWLNTGANRVVEILIYAGIAYAGGRLGEAIWGPAVVALGALAAWEALRWTLTTLDGQLIASYRGVRWLLISLLMIGTTPTLALTGTALFSAGLTTVFVTRAWLQRSRTMDFIVPGSEGGLARRFATPPVSFVDAGVVLRATTHAFGGRLSRFSSQLLPAAFAFVGISVALSWGGKPWLVLIAVGMLVVAVAAALAGPFAGPRGWWLPAALRIAEFLVILSVASSLGSAGQAWAFLLGVGLLLVTSDSLDRHRRGRGAQPPWVSVCDLGFDGRLLLLTALATSGVALGGLALIAAILVAVWLGQQYSWLRWSK